MSERVGKSVALENFLPVGSLSMIAFWLNGIDFLFSSHDPNEIFRFFALIIYFYFSYEKLSHKISMKSKSQRFI